jgi:excisionase family DNA binding protein
MTDAANEEVAPPQNGSDLRFFGPSANPALASTEPLPTLVDIQAVSISLGISMRQVRRFVADGQIPFLRIGHLIRFDARELNEWIDARRTARQGGAGSIPRQAAVKGDRRSAERTLDGCA